MIQKDYRTIAEILKRWFERRGNSTLDIDLAVNLANYFESEDDLEGHKKNLPPNVKIARMPPWFNKEQFIKDCLVE